MSDKKFKVGDRVKIINCSSIESYELNKIGVVINVEKWDVYRNYVVDMGRARRPDDPEDGETCWWLQENMIELVTKPNQQLEFAFMQTDS